MDLAEASPLNSFLTGIRVLDLSRHLPGPLATLVLADLGATIIKVEPPAGDEMRWIGADDEGPSAYFRAVNGGKTSVTLNLKTSEGRCALEQMAVRADVLVESFRPGVMARLGLSPERLRAMNPRLIYCAMTGFGQTGSQRDTAGHDLNFLAMTGLLSAAAGGDAPRVPYPPPADCGAGLNAVIAILGALIGRVATGNGVMIDLAVAEAPFPQFVFSFAELAARKSGAINAVLGGAAAYYAVYPVKDGFVTLGAIEPKFWMRFCDAAGRPDWRSRQTEKGALRGEIESMFATMTTAEAEQRFAAADCCFAVVVDFDTAAGKGYPSERGLIRAGEDGLIQSLFPVLVDGKQPRTRPPLREVCGADVLDEMRAAMDAMPGE